MKYSQSKNIEDYLECFSLIYYSFLKYDKSNFERNFPNCIIDFENWITNENGTGHANVWVQPTHKHFFTPVIKSSYSNIEIKGLRIQIKTKLLEVNGNNKIVRFEIAALYNPDIWLGRNLSILQPLNKIIITGFDRVILEEDLLFSSHLIKYISQNFALFLRETLKFYGFREQIFIDYN